MTLIDPPHSNAPFEGRGFIKAKLQSIKELLISNFEMWIKDSDQRENSASCCTPMSTIRWLISQQTRDSARDLMRLYRLRFQMTLIDIALVWTWWETEFCSCLMLAITIIVNLLKLRDDIR
ncbi:hypothetical protein OS493_039217 [Desmophyllum pertusum]|uniref:Uncharacterized protein n=1 Tax=Desmophyllum pertusum TaxID=174260 RepID=A0A9W9ZUR0_9CNID|nr:hypothetical protein OS493_039217 [Desmophyllum pertusum]